MSIQITVLGTEQLAAKFDQVTPAFLRRMKEGMTSAMSMLSSYVKREKLSGQVLKNRTGTLRRSINAKITVGTDSVTGQVGTNLVYAKAHEFGATIEAKRAKFLAFRGRDGFMIFRKRVVIPPRPFLAPSFRENKGAIFAKLQIAGRQAAHDLRA